jgi:hypothetical protein
MRAGESRFGSETLLKAGGWNKIKSNEFSSFRKTRIIKLDCAAAVTYLSFGRYLLDDFGFCDLARNRTNFPSDSNKSFSVTFAEWFNIIC